MLRVAKLELVRVKKHWALRNRIFCLAGIWCCMFPTFFVFRAVVLFSGVFCRCLLRLFDSRPRSRPYESFAKSSKMP